MKLAERVLRTVRDRDLLHTGDRVLVALSGGADSVALVHLLRELEAQQELTLAGVAHFNHGLRGAEADEDEAFCRELAQSLGLPCVAARGDVRALARAQGRSIEDSGRVARYAFLEDAADRLSAGRIAVAHTVDDQAETFLLRLLRGAGPRGLSGIRPRVGRIVRPLIDIRRAALRDYLADGGRAYREDSTNRDVSIPRNRVRHVLLPTLEVLSPAAVTILAREASIAASDDEYLTQEAVAAARQVLSTVRDAGPPDRTAVTAIDMKALRSLHPAIASRVARIALTRRASNQCIGLDQVERLIAFASSGRAGSALSLPGQQAVHRGERVELGPEPPRGKTAGASNSFRVLLSIPGETTLAHGWTLTAELLDDAAWRAVTWASRGPVVAVALAGLRLPLTVRGREPGDRFRPLGLAGRKKLQDFLVDRKIPRNCRDFVPLVVDADDRIVWVVGEAIAEEFRVTEPAKGALRLKARRSGGTR